MNVFQRFTSFFGLKNDSSQAETDGIEMSNYDSSSSSSFEDYSSAQTSDSEQVEADFSDDKQKPPPYPPKHAEENLFLRLLAKIPDSYYLLALLALSGIFTGALSVSFDFLVQLIHNGQF